MTVVQLNVGARIANSQTLSTRALPAPRLKSHSGKIRHQQLVAMQIGDTCRCKEAVFALMDQNLTFGPDARVIAPLALTSQAQITNAARLLPIGT